MSVRRIRSCLLALPLIAAAVPACTDPGGPGRPGPLGDYGFLVEIDDQFHVVDGDGRTTRTVLPAGVPGMMPDVSIDGSRIAFIRPVPIGGGSFRSEVATIGIDGQGLLVVTGATESALRPRLAPDAVSLAYTVSSMTEPHMYFDDLVVQSPGVGSRRVLEGTKDQVKSLAWYPTGERIAFEQGTGIWEVRADGTGLRQLTAGWHAKPDWSPDGTRLAYERLAIGSRAVCILVIATAEENCVGIDGWGAQPRWSPAGEWLALIGNDGGLYTVDRDGGSPMVRIPGWRMQGTAYDWMRLR